MGFVELKAAPKAAFRPGAVEDIGATKTTLINVAHVESLAPWADAHGAVDAFCVLQIHGDMKPIAVAQPYEEVKALLIR